MFQATLASVTGSATASTTSTSNASVGLVNVSDIAGGRVAGTTQTAVLLSSGTLVVFGTGSTPGASAYDLVSVTGGTISSVTGSLTSVSANLTTASYFSAGKNSWGVVITPNAGVTNMTVSYYTNAGASALSSPTSGTLSGYINVTVAASSTAGTLSAAKSGVYYGANVTTDNTAVGTGTSNYDTAQEASVIIKDAYGSFLTSGLVQAVATNGAYVALASGSAAATPTSSTNPFVTMNGAYISLKVLPSVSTGSNTTVTVSINGTVVGTKSFTFTGKVAKVVLSSPTNGTMGSTGKITLSFADSLGAAIYPSAANTAAPAALSKNAGTTTGYGTSTVTWPTSSASGSILYTCTSSQSKGNVAVDYTNADGTVVTSNSLAVSCSNVPVTYTAAFDKSKYVPGDIATLTVTFKDSTGALAADTAAGSTGITKGAGTTTTPVIAGSQLTAVSAPTNADTTTNGVVTYKFIVGSTAGSYSASVDFPNVDSATTPQGAVTVSYAVSDGSTSLNDVLKGIVSLIASINKQIAALAKLVAPAKKK